MSGVAPKSETLSMCLGNKPSTRRRGLLSVRFGRLIRPLDHRLNGLIEERRGARKAKDFKAADRIRDELAAMGITRR